MNCRTGADGTSFSARGTAMNISTQNVGEGYCHGRHSGTGGGTGATQSNLNCAPAVNTGGTVIASNIYRPVIRLDVEPAVQSTDAQIIVGSYTTDNNVGLNVNQAIRHDLQ